MALGSDLGMVGFHGAECVLTRMASMSRLSSKLSRTALGSSAGVDVIMGESGDIGAAPIWSKLGSKTGKSMSSNVEGLKAAWGLMVALSICSSKLMVEPP